MGEHSVSVDQETCIGCGACEALCPNHFRMEEKECDLKAVAIKSKIEKEEEVQGCKEAAECCPVQCIYVKDVT